MRKRSVFQKKVFVLSALILVLSVVCEQAGAVDPRLTSSLTSTTKFLGNHQLMSRNRQPIQQFIQKSPQGTDKQPGRWDPFLNKWCFLICYVSGMSFDFNYFTYIAIAKLFLGDPSAPLWWDYGHLKPFRLGQLFTQVAANYSENQSGFIVSLGLLGPKVGNISRANPMVTFEKFTGVKITFNVRVDDSFGPNLLMSEKCLYVGFASAVYEGDIPD